MQDFLFAEEFSHTPLYAFPDGSNGGFWVQLRNGRITVGTSPASLPALPDKKTEGRYAPTLPLGRTVVSVMTEGEKKEQGEFVPKAVEHGHIKVYSPSGRDLEKFPMPKVPSSDPDSIFSYYK